MAEYYVHQTSAEEQARIRSFVTWALAVTFAITVVVIGFVLAARWWLPLIPVETEQRFADRYVGLLAEDAAADDPAVAGYLEKLAGELASVMEMPAGIEIRVHYVDAPDANAFASLGGHVFVFRGLLESLETENALAMVLAHELGHVANRDPLIGAGRAALLSLLLYSATGQSGVPGDLVDLGGDLAMLGYSREQERVADATALAALQRRYGHVGGATDFFERMLASGVGEGDDTGLAELLSTHPQLEERIESLRQQAAERGWASGPQAPLPAPVRAGS